MREAGFTLVELMIAVAILAIIAAVAMPIYNQYTQRTFRAEAQADLMNCAQGMERYAAVNFDYDGADDAFLAGTICNPRSVDRYTITVDVPENEPDQFTLTATAIGQMVGTGDLTYDNTGARTWNGNDSWEE